MRNGNLSLKELMKVSQRSDYKKTLIVETVTKLYEEGHLTEFSTYKEKREIANKLEWTIGRLHKGIDMYLELKKLERDIRNQINNEANKIERETEKKNKEEGNGQ